MTCVNKAQWQLAIDVIETIKELAISAACKMPHRHFQDDHHAAQQLFP
ncbi:hypothetical protein QCD79_24170 [Pseudomonas quasicaspiana]|nr:hypothetical protein [Pseudomonas quasicaspiana]